MLRHYLFLNECPEFIHFALTDTTTSGKPVSWRWTCGNGQTFTNQNVGVNRIWYNNAGTSTITLLVTDANGTTRTASHTITVTN